MKKIIVLVLCVANVTCFAMNKDKGAQELIELQKRQTDALELLATSHAVKTCMKIQEHNKTNVIEYNHPSCLFLSAKFEELAKKRSWK